MELKRAAELCIVSLLGETLSDLSFYPGKGGGDDVTPAWKSSHIYSIGDILRPTNHSLIHVVVVTASANSGPTEPAFDDVIGNTYGGMAEPTYQTTASLSVDTAEDSGNPEPPFGVVMIEEGEKTISYQETDILHGTVTWVTRADTENVVTHSGDFKRIYDAMTQIGYGYDIMRRLMVHGVDVGVTSEFTDGARQAHGDVLHFTMAVTEKPAQAG